MDEESKAWPAFAESFIKRLKLIYGKPTQESQGPVSSVSSYRWDFTRRKPGALDCILLITISPSLGRATMWFLDIENPPPLTKDFLLRSEMEVGQAIQELDLTCGE